jgi:hypothetical protein
MISKNDNYNRDDILRAYNRQIAYSAEAKEEGEAALLRAKMELAKGLKFSARDSMREARISFYFAKARKKLADEYKQYLK